MLNAPGPAKAMSRCDGNISRIAGETHSASNGLVNIKGPTM